MKVVFRTDASLDIGTGHVMRCLTLANALRERGAKCHFICRNHPGNLGNKIAGFGFGVSLLSSVGTVERTSSEDGEHQPAHAGWLGCGWQLDARQSSAVLRAKRPDWLVVDHYALDYRWERAQRENTSNIMVIDDLADRSHDCDMLLDQNLGRKESDYAVLVPPDCCVLTGSAYALLRPSFAELREYSLNRRKGSLSREVLVSLGGLDRDNVTGRVLLAIRNSGMTGGMSLKVVLGSGAPHVDRIDSLIRSLSVQGKLLVDVPHMADIMAKSDIAIGAAGMSSWERCCLGVPAVVVVLAANQNRTAIHLSEYGACTVVPLDEHFNSRFGQELSALLSNPGRLAQMSTAAAEICDGQGVCRVLEILSSGQR